MPIFLHNVLLHDLRSATLSLYLFSWEWDTEDVMHDDGGDVFHDVVGAVNLPKYVRRSQHVWWEAWGYMLLACVNACFITNWI